VALHLSPLVPVAAGRFIRKRLCAHLSNRDSEENCMREESIGNACRRTDVDAQIERCVQFALRGALANHCANDERRRQKRHPFPYPIRLIPVDSRSEAIDDPIIVLGKHLTSHGLDFYYQHPVSHRRVIASFDCELQERSEILMDLTWCRFNGHGWYENGGRFLSAVNTSATDASSGIVTQVDAVISTIDVAAV
jgi:hypothetical protein